MHRSGWSSSFVGARQSRVLIFGAVLSVLAYGLMSPILGVLLPGYPLNPAQLGNLGLCNALGLVVASLLAGPLVDLKGKKFALLLGLAIMTVSLALLPHADHYQPLLALYFTLGAGGGIVSTASNSLASEIAPERRASTLNFLNLFFGLGGIVTTLAASYFLSAIQLCYLVAAVAVLALITNLGARLTKQSAAGGFMALETIQLLANPTLLLLSLMLFLYVACEVGVWNWLKAYLISLHFDARSAGGIVSYGFAFGILAGRVIAARLSRVVNEWRLVFASGLLITAATYAMLQFHSHWGVTIAVFCAGLFMAPVFPTVLAMVGDQFPGRASAMGIAITSGWIGLAVSSPVIGRLAADTSLHSALLLLPVLSGTFVLVSMVLNNRLRIALLK